MPIRPELREFYGPDWLEKTRPRILERAGNKCEHCGKPLDKMINTVTGRHLVAGPTPAIVPVMFWSLPPRLIITGQVKYSRWWNHRGKVDRDLLTNGVDALHALYRETMRLDRVRHMIAQLGIAHLNNVAGDDRDENLRALCQWCHLRHDAQFHHEQRGSRKDQARPLLFTASPTESPPPEMQSAVWLETAESATVVLSRRIEWEPRDTAGRTVNP